MSELNDFRDFHSAHVDVRFRYFLRMGFQYREPHQFLPPRNLRQRGHVHCVTYVIRVFSTHSTDVIVLGWVPSVGWGGHNKDLGMAAEFDISKHSTCHDIHDDQVWVDHYETKRRSGRNMGGKKCDDYCEVECDSDANMMTPVRRKHQECR